MTALADLVQPDFFRPASLAGERSLPLVPGLEGLFPPPGLRRGTTVVVTGELGQRSLALGLAAGASTAGSWCAAITLPDLGLVAAAELGVALERLALIPSVPPAQWVTVVGALLDALDVVIARPPPHLRHGDARRLTARARERGAVLVVCGATAEAAWTDGAEIRLTVTGRRWEGPGSGDGQLQGRRLDVSVGGRGAAARPRTVGLWLPAPGGGITAIDAATNVAVLRSVG